MTHPVREQLATLGETIREQFANNRRVLSFGEYLELVHTQPARQLRGAAQYMVDCFDHYGTVDVAYPWGTARRFQLFDAAWDAGRDRLIGQEAVQNQVYRALQNFVRD